MKYFATLFFTIFAFTIMQGQTIVDINADYVFPGIGNSLELVLKKNKSFIVTEVMYDDNDRTFYLDTTILEDYSFSEVKKYIGAKRAFLPVSQLYKNKADKFISFLAEHQFNHVFEDGFIRHKINITKDHNLLVRDYSSDASLNEFATIPFAILRINKEYHILAIDDNDRDVYLIMQTSKNNFTQIGIGQDKLQIIKKEPNDSIINELINFNNNQKYRVDEKIAVPQIIKEKGKYGMKNLLGEQVIPCIYDTIILPNEDELFLALKKGKGILYSRYFKQIANNIRCVFPFRNLFSPYIVLQNNKLRYISDDFKICDTLKKCTYVVDGGTFYSFEIEKTENGFKIYKKIGGFTEVVLQVFPYFLDEKYDNLFFLNGQNKFSYEDYEDIVFQKPDFLIFEKNKQFGIIEIEMPLLDCRQDSLNKYNGSWYDYIEKKIVFEYQNIMPKIIVSELDSVVFSSKYDYPAKIYKNGLCTYFPISKEPRYAEIQNFNRYFARFRLPNGKEGWLSHDGVEYIDE